MSIVLRILVSSHHELPFVQLNLLESFGKVDRVLICEADYTHTGKERDFIFGHLLDQLPKEVNNVEYLPMKIGPLIDWSKEGGELYHQIERVIRHQFCAETIIDKNDVVVAVDADEIVYHQTYDWISSKFQGRRFLASKPIRLKMHQFFYKLNYYWFNTVFASPIATQAKSFLHSNCGPMQWRDEGKITNFYAGCHFSWIMDIEDMIKKLRNYAHFDIYGNFAREEVLQKAIREKRYPFDSSVDFQIKVIPSNDVIYPKRFSEVFSAEHRWFGSE